MTQAATRQTDRQTFATEKVLCTVTFMGPQGRGLPTIQLLQAQRPLGCQLDEDQLQCHITSSVDEELLHPRDVRHAHPDAQSTAAK